MKLEVKNTLGQVYYRGEYIAKEDWIQQSWTGYVTAQEVIEATKQIMDTFNGVKYSKVLNDSSKGAGAWEEANEWLAQHWMPKAIADGLRKFAFVVSEDIFSSLSSEDLVTKVPGTGFEMRTFQNTAQAEAWLKAN
jgi:hypothetical protein